MSQYTLKGLVPYIYCGSSTKQALAEFMGSLKYHTWYKTRHMDDLDTIPSTQKVIDAKAELNSAHTKFTESYQFLDGLLEDIKPNIQKCTSQREANKLWMTDEKAIAACTSMDEAYFAFYKAAKTAMELYGIANLSLETPMNR